MSDEATLKAEFERFDTDANGTIDEAEFTALVQELSSGLTSDQAAVAFLAIDVNGNRRIEFGEFCAWWKKYRLG
jgi:Ca2+-binding EF-hand superfamily protein